MTINEVAERLGKSKWAIYKMIQQGRGIGQDFFKNEFGVWVVDGCKVR